MKQLHILLLFIILSFLSCSKDTGLVTLTLDVDGVEPQQRHDSFDLGKSILSDHCTRISCALFQNGERVKLITQQSDNSDFGRLSLRVPAGQYVAVVIAHSGQQNCSVTALNKITFNGKCTDTFYTLDTLDLTADTICPIVLKRAVAKYQLCTTDSVPAEVKQVKFYYTGGSSTFSAVSGFGSVNSRQTEYREVSQQMIGHPAIFEIYTFPHQEADTLKINIQALNSASTPIYQTELTDIPIRSNWITQQTLPLFTQQNHDNTLNLTLADSASWSGIITL